jgi:HK97 family phage portal protein
VSVWFRSKPKEARGIWSVPWADSLPSGRAYRDTHVSTLEQSLQVIAVRSAVDLIASAVSELPFDVFTGSGKTARQVATPSYLTDPAGDGTGVEDWTYMLLSCWMLKGNAFGHVLDTRGSYPTQVDLKHPDRVGATPDGRGGLNWTFNGATVPAAEVWHHRVNPIPDTVFGLSLIAAHAADMGLALTLTTFGKDYFDNGAHPGAVLKNTEEDINSPRVARKVKDSFLNSLRGREPIVVGKKWEYTPITINPEESQFLETRGFTAAECAHMFGPGVAEILGYQLPSGSSTLTYANVVDRSVHLLQYAIGKWVRRAQRVLSSFLPRPQVVRFNTAALLQTTVMQRYQAHNLALNSGKGWKTINEVRADEDLPPVPWGNEPFAGEVQQPSDGASEEEETQ